MVRRQLGKTPFELSPVGFGAFKIGRNQGIKYPSGYDLPSVSECERLLNGVLDLGVNWIDTAPAYGLSEARIGQHLAHRRGEFVLSSKAGETFADGRSTYDFSGAAIRASLERSLKRLRTDAIDVFFLHSDGRDLEILRETDAVETLLALREEGKVRAVGLSGKTPEGAEEALAWADVLMVEHNARNPFPANLFEQAQKEGVGIVAKKALGSGTLPPAEAIRFALEGPAVASLAIGSLSLAHLEANLRAAERPLA